MNFNDISSMLKKTSVYNIILIIFVMLLIGCTNNSPKKYVINQLIRVDVEVVNTDESYEEAFMITDEETVDVLRTVFKQVKWEPNAEPKMARKEDVKSTLYFKYDENMPERLFVYQIWFNQNDTATIISNNEKDGYGTLDKDNAETLEQIFLKK
ncbi:hypothetical protein P9D43_28615 [Neobacillus niacini]|uniref:hypothetical protein n=1 Tax=Neobacillus niacini TaxID=86668 RepID=UPI0007ABC05C|nr:hypothetical protein [Neobacillus niacini]MEC1525966.1 hypothetical protein [Neobacillus niacini]